MIIRKATCTAAHRVLLLTENLKEEKRKDHHTRSHLDWQSRRIFWEPCSKQKGVQLGRRMNLERKKMVVGMCVFCCVA